MSRAENKKGQPELSTHNEKPPKESPIMELELPISARNWGKWTALQEYSFWVDVLIINKFQKNGNP